MAGIVPLPREKRLRSLDEFAAPAWLAARRSRRPAAFGLLLLVAVAAGAAAGLLLPI